MNRFNYRHLICSLLILGSLLLSVFVYSRVFFRTIEGLRDLGLSVAYFFSALFMLNTRPTVTVIQPPSLDLVTFLPMDSSAYVAKFTTYWQSLISGQTYVSFFDGVGLGVLSVLSSLVLLIPLFILFRVAFKRMLNRENNRYNLDSRPLRFWRRFVQPAGAAVHRFFSDLILFIRDTGHGVYWKILLIIWLYNFNVYTIVAEVFAYVMYFAVSFDVAHLYLQFYKFAVDCSLGLSALPWYLWIVVALPVFQYWRHHVGIKRLRHHEKLNRKIRNILPVTSILVGSMGVGKTTHDVDLTLSKEADFRGKALSTLQKYDLMFPSFPWIVFENTLRQVLDSGRAYNLASLRAWILDCRLNFDVCPCREYCFTYDFERYGFTVNDGLVIRDIFDVLEIYAQAYFIYICQSSLIVSNLSVRTDGICLDKGNLPLWDYDFFTRDPNDMREVSGYSHILNWDMLRLGKKFVDNRKAYGLEFGVFSITEIFKDRGNQFETQGQRADSAECNSKNDRFNWMLKTCRHAATVDNYPYFVLLGDDQREDSGPADLRELMTVISIGRNKERGLAFPLFGLEWLVISGYLWMFDNSYTQYRHNRGDNTLLMYLLHSLAARLSAYMNRIDNIYGYNVTNLILTDGKNDDLLGSFKYYLSDKKIYSNRFDTACFRDYFSRRALASGIGLDDIPTYESTTASLDELRAQQSYMLSEIDSLTSIVHPRDTDP